MDAFGRTIDYLRLSLTDRCNERCLYCLPHGYQGWEREPDPLTAAELVRVARVAVGLGFRKFRLTGGEPLLRADVLEIVRALSTMAGVESVALTTNGARLAELAQPLRTAGLRTINISLDALAAPVYHRITGGNVDAVRAGLHAALTTDFERVKLNCVLMRGLNEQELWPLVLFAAEHRVPLRLIELMPLTTTDVLTPSNFYPVEEAMRRLGQHDELIALPDPSLGWGPAKYYRLKQTGVLVGFIGALTCRHFCVTCNKMRLTADGKLRPCLGQHAEFDVRAALRTTTSDDAVRQVFLEALSFKPGAHQFCDHYQPGRPMTAIGG